MSLLNDIYSFIFDEEQSMRGRKRPSFTSETLITGTFPDKANAIHPIINVSMSFSQLPTKSELNKNFTKLLDIERFRNAVEKNKYSGKCYFVERSELIDLDSLIIWKTVKNTQDMHDSIDKECSNELDGSDGLPVWRICVFENKDKNCDSCIVFRVHHVVGDGMSLVAAMDKVFTSKDGGSIMSDLALLKGKNGNETPKSSTTKANKKSLNIFGVILSAFTSLFHVLLLGMTAYDTHTAGTIPTGADLTMIKENRKTVLYPPFKLNFIKSIKNAAGVTVNDVLVSAVTGSLRRYHELMNELSDSSKNTSELGDNPLMRVLMPVALPRKWDVESEFMRNYFVMISVNLPIAPTTVKERLIQCSKTMWEMKNSMMIIVQSFIQNYVLANLPQFVTRQLVFDIFSRHSLVMSNVPGPSAPVYLCGKKLNNIQVIFPNLIHQCLLISYNGLIFMNKSVDPNVVTNNDLFIDCFFKELVDLAKEYNISCEKKDIFM